MYILRVNSNVLKKYTGSFSFLNTIKNYIIFDKIFELNSMYNYLGFNARKPVFGVCE